MPATTAISLPSSCSGRTSLERRVAPRHEARRGAVIGIGEIGAAARVRRDRDRGHHRVAAVFVERRHQRVEPAHLHRAGDLQLLADHPREIDVEAGRIAVRAGIVERRIVDLGEKADQRDARQVGTLWSPSRIPEAGHGHGRRPGACCRSGGCSRRGAGRLHLHLHLGDRGAKVNRDLKPCDNRNPPEHSQWAACRRVHL